MRITRFHLPQELASNTTIELSPEASHYAASVLRLKASAPLIVFNGKGGEYDAELVVADRKKSQIQINRFNPKNNESELTTHLAIGLSKGDRFDWVLQKATELGVTEITPLWAERTEVKINPERLDKKQQHWQKIIISACEQCQRNVLPKLNSPAQLHDFFEQENSETKFILHHHSEQPLEASLKPKAVCLLVGSEGGFSDAEFQQATQKGFTPLALGQRVLRTETAPLAALSVMQFLWGDLA